MKKSFSRGEKLLLLAPLPFLAILLVGQVWKRETVKARPETLKLPQAVSQAFFLEDKKILVVMYSQAPRGNTLYTGAIYEIGKPNPLKTVALPSGISSVGSRSQTSLEGKYWIVEETDFRTNVSQMVLRDTENLKTIKIFQNQYFDVKWTGEKRFLIDELAERVQWRFDAKQKWVKKTAGNQELLANSPDGQWQVERLIEEPVQFWNNQMGEERRQSTYRPKSHWVHSIPPTTKPRKLPGSLWQALSWQKDSRELWGVSVLENAIDRADILRFDLASGQTVSTQLEIPRNTLSSSWVAIRFKFSPDGRILAASAPDQSLIVWDATTGKLLKKFFLNHRRPGQANGDPQFSLDSQKLLRVTKEGLEIYRLDQLLPR